LLERPEAERAPTPPVAADAISLLSSRVDRLAESFEAFRTQFETADLARQRHAAEEAQLSEARLLEQLSRSLARASGELLEARGTLRPPRLPSDWNERPTVTPSGVVDATAPPGPSVRGVIDGVSLSTLLGAFELERRDGVFRLVASSGSVEFELRRGALVRGRVDGRDTEVVAALGRAFDFTFAEFRFEAMTVTADSDAPRSLNGLLLEVFHQRDQARRTG
jgi:hypothetical protein